MRGALLGDAHGIEDERVHLGLVGSLAMFLIHNMFDNLLVHGVGIQVGVLLGLIGGVSDR